jgi:hypothetical protein
MKFYVVWDKHTNDYYRTKSGAHPRIYVSHAFAASAISGTASWYATADEKRRLRQERYEIREYETEEYKVVG